MNQAVSVARSTGNQIVSVFRSLGGQLRSAGSYAGQGFRNGLASQVGSIMATARSMANAVSSTINKALRIHSPSRVTEASGGFTGEGFNNGLASWIGKVSKTAGNLANSAMVEAQSCFDNMSANLNGVKSNMQANSTVNHVINDKLSSAQPMIVNLMMGDQAFRAYVEDISSEQTRKANLELGYL